MTKEQIEKWKEVRRKGAARFVLVNGLLAWGLPMFIIMAFITRPFSEGLATPEAMAHYVTWPVAGVLFGVAIWWFAERRYGRAVSSDSPS